MTVTDSLGGVLGAAADFHRDLGRSVDVTGAITRQAPFETCS